MKLVKYESMKIKKILFLIILVMTPIFCLAQNKMIWQIGESDNNCQEFALAPKDYNKFLEKDFGWEDGFFVIGHSDAKKDFPYVLPGAMDYWGGTSGLSGIRPHQLNLLFGIEENQNGEIGIW